MLKKKCFEKFAGFRSAHCGGYTVSLAFSQFLVLVNFALHTYYQRFFTIYSVLFYEVYCTFEYELY